jgi:DUF4097 and DUF4098 domain-containing protein YvlB
MRTTLVSRLVIGLALVAWAAPARAAVTARGAVPDDNARAGWLERYAEARQGPETVEKVTQTFKVGPQGSLDLTGISGDVKVTGGDGAEIRVEATKRVRHRSPADAKRLLGELRIDFNQFNSRVEVRTVYARRSMNYERGSSASVDYVVTVPSDAAVAVKTISGSVVVTAVRGEVRAEAISGDVEVSATPNLALAKTVSGNVTARDIASASTLMLGTVSGNVTASGLKVRALECGSVSGDLNLSGVQVERVAAKSVSGSIVFDAPLAKGGRYEFTTHSGDVRVTVPAGAGFELDANTFSGSVRSDLPVTLRGGGQGGERGGIRTIRGTHGDAGAFLTVRSFNGSVVILKK